MLPNLDICLFFFGENFAIRQIQRCLLQIWKHFLKILVEKLQIRHFWSQIQTLLFFSEIFEIDKFEGVDFKCDYSFFKILALKYPNKVFLVPNLKFSCFWMKLCMLTNSKMLISNTTLVFEILAENTIKAASVRNLRIFRFSWNFVFRKIWGCWCKIPQRSSFFEFQPKNTQIRQFWSFI